MVAASYALMVNISNNNNKVPVVHVAVRMNKLLKTRIKDHVFTQEARLGD